MNATTRRTMLAALLGLGAAGGLEAVLPPLRAAPASPLRLPDTALRLVRVLERGLGENAVITVQRSWEVRFENQARGVVVSGRQIAAAVDAPPHLSELAQLERQRDASAMFPIMLSESGLILTLGGTLAPTDDITAALRAAEALIAQQPVPADERAQYRFYLAQVHAAGVSLLDTLPSDLFFPAGGVVERDEVLALPDGLSGHFALRYGAEPQADAPWLKQAERRVVTQVQGLQRNAREAWTLGPL